MGFFPSTIAAELAGRTVAASLLCFMDFKDAPRRWWTGFGSLEAGGYTWQGLGELIQIDGLDQPLGTIAPKATFTLSGIDPTIVTLARNASDRVKGRRATVYIQIFDVTPDDAGVEPWTPLEAPYAISSWIMDQMTYSGQGPSQRTITLTAESLWTNRRRPAHGFLTDRDQNKRFPGDRGLEQVVDLVSKSIRWPVFVFWLLAGIAVAALAPLLYPFLPPGEV